MATKAEALAQAFQYHQAGHFPQAEQLYRQILELDPANAQILDLLGTMAYQQGRYPEALDYFRRAAWLAPHEASFHNNLGLVYQTLQQRDEALACYQQALRLRPDFAEAHTNLGNALQDRGNLDEAMSCYRQALRLRPDLARAHYNLASALREQGRLDDAIASYRQALHVQPDFPEALNNLGNALADQNQREQAIVCYREALRLRPDYPEALTNLGNALVDQDRGEQAMVCYREALRLRPDYPEALHGLGNALKDQGQLDEAIACHRQALHLRPAYPEAYGSLGNLFAAQGRLEEAYAFYEEALRLRPDFPEAHVNRSLVWLLQGNFAKGWAGYEWRLRCADARPRAFPQPCWQGAALHGQTILLYTEQGLGDALQFSRYATLVHERGGTVLLGCRPELQRLLATCPGIAAVIGEGQALPAFDVQAPLLSVPGTLGTTLDTIPAQVPYLTADPTLVSRWRQEIGTHGFRVGIVWQGSLSQRDDRRPAPLGQFAALAEVPGVRLYSLQKGPGARHLADAGFAITDLGSRLDDFADTAAVLKNLDLVVTVDTAAAHLAGALAVPVWVALSLVPDWRWLREREDSPWYPTMRLFRQQQPGQWPDVFARIAEELRKLINRRGEFAAVAPPQ